MWLVDKTDDYRLNNKAVTPVRVIGKLKLEHDSNFFHSPFFGLSLEACVKKRSYIKKKIK